MREQISKRVAVVGVMGALLLAGCATPQQTNTAVGTGAGAAVGAGVGALVGHGKGAAIGAGIGAVAGGLIGYNWKTVKDDVQQSAASSLGVDVVEMPDGSLKVSIPSNVSFDTGRATLKPALLPVLDSVAKSVEQHPELRVKTVGHTDNTGSVATNQKLSQARAQAVATYLSRHGVAASRIMVEGRAATDPIGDNSTVDGRAANRRVEIYLYAVKQ
ncbi:OmpA family protein [Bordetella holmesii]|uniref:OmpA/MotB/Pal peptidoglycan-associating domain protein n=2 Tax=Bordetella holmesii TaxID=35814 RepID=A0A158M5V4_9BORD|nr:OmpA family protein [Bordetella holmesii]AHV91328.1 glycine-zipper containing OmpA-like membrane domain protein [Bordetella holmesii ATCC 51541]AIT25723.1 glycine-zipper containing OmpA-like membrane domain protein [Bordetella holmesii 44057]EWM41557.1 glycine-zipper containing OmpA-like membrane domain protein [Bordetella holmesii 41130]EWM46288.1 glycine-zipper containing OmpA-like membrane domain protein [Bordetella holmesii 35009]EWM50445.1 glycine-zipper containing OmpA-like membrane d